MKECKASFRCALKKLAFSRRSVVLCFAAILVFLISVSLIFAFSANTSGDLTSAERQKILEEYSNKITVTEGVIAQAEESGQILKDKDRLLYELLEYRFYVTSGTVKSEYMNFYRPFDVPYKGGFLGLAMYLGNAFQYFAVFLGVLSAAVFFILDYRKNHIKNYLVSGVKRKYIFFGRSLAALAFTALPFAVFYVICVIAIVVSPSLSAVIYFSGGFISVSVKTVLFSRCLNAFVLCVFFFALTLSIGQITKGLSYPIMFFTFFYGLILLIFGLRRVKFITEGMLSRLWEMFYKYPILSMQYNYSGFKAVFFLSIGIHAVIAFLLILFSYKRFLKQDY